MLNFVKKLFDPSKKAIAAAYPTVHKINALEKEYEKKSIDEIKQLIADIKTELKPLVDAIDSKYKNSLKVTGKHPKYVSQELKVKEKLLSRLPEVYAAIREVTKRNAGIRHFDVQLLASSILALGYKLTELKTGEGKTLVFQMPAALYGLTGRGSHVITVNDYLAKRDGEYAGHILSQLGITVGVVTSEGAFKFIPNEEVKNYKDEEKGKIAVEQKVTNPGDCEGLNLLECDKTEAYGCEVVYGTNTEFGFDYLRDNMTNSIKAINQTELYFCIVDEADSILIDEARTPLIISAPAEQSNDLYNQFAKLVPRLVKEKDFTVDEKAHHVALTDNGAEKMQKLLGVPNIWQDFRLAHHLDNALKAQYLYNKDKHYLVRDGQVYIVDEFTGRILDGRRYSEGLHQAIEAKEAVEIKRESKTLATITYQNFFRLYKILAGGSGTLMTETEEFYKIYNLECIEIPTNRDMSRMDMMEKVYRDMNAKFNAVVEEVIEIHKSGRPILIGTSSIEDSEEVSRRLEAKGIEHEVLNAKQHEREAKIVANAGKKGAITVATNMAGRGTDIKLGGKDATKEEREEIVKLGGLYIIGTQRHESRRIDNQLRGRSGRQGEPGTSQFFVSLDDEIMRIQGGDAVKRLMTLTNIPDDMPLQAGLIGRSIENAQKRMEGMHFDTRKTVVEYDDVVNQQREIFYSRRRRLLEEIEKAIDPENTTKEKQIGSLQNQLKEKLNNEIKKIIDIHFMDSRDDFIDVQKLISDFVNLANDELINKHTVEIYQDNVSLNYPVSENLLKLLDKKPKQEIEHILTKIIDKAFEGKMSEFGEDIPTVSKFLVLKTMDELWTDHLDYMKDLRDGIGLRGYAQQDPLVEYKNEAFDIFDKFINNIDSEIAKRVLKVQKVVVPRREILQQTTDTENNNSGNLQKILSAVNSSLNPANNQSQQEVNNQNKKKKKKNKKKRK
jgi:preprotein translocase subunit SecA